MKKYIIICFGLVSSILLFAQSPELAPLPPKFSSMSNVVQVNHFPSPVFASLDNDEPNTFFWKHTTSIMTPINDLTIEEGGAYIFYNDQWNLRVSLSAKEFSKLFGIQKGVMKAGQPYTFVDNWRRDKELRGGWAMWYVIGHTTSGNRVYGVGKLDTVGELYEAQ